MDIDSPNVTRLSNRDRDALLAILGDADARPNKALRAAAKRYVTQEKTRARNTPDSGKSGQGRD